MLSVQQQKLLNLQQPLNFLFFCKMYYYSPSVLKMLIFTCAILIVTMLHNIHIANTTSLPAILHKISPGLKTTNTMMITDRHRDKRASSLLIKCLLTWWPGIYYHWWQQTKQTTYYKLLTTHRCNTSNNTEWAKSLHSIHQTLTIKYKLTKHDMAILKKTISTASNERFTVMTLPIPL